MNESLVLSKDLSQKLVEAGIVLETECMWVGDEVWDKTEQSDYETPATLSRSKWIPAPLTDELLRVMPAEMEYEGNHTRLMIGKYDGYYWAFYSYDNTVEIYPEVYEDPTPVNNLGSLILVPEVLAVVKQNMKGE